MCYLQSARSSARFHGEHGGQAGAALQPWTESLCERPESPRCWRIKTEREKTLDRHIKISVYVSFFVYFPAVLPYSGVPKIVRIKTLAYAALAREFLRPQNKKMRFLCNGHLGLKRL